MSRLRSGFRLVTPAALTPRKPAQVRISPGAMVSFPPSANRPVYCGSQPLHYRLIAENQRNAPQNRGAGRPEYRAEHYETHNVPTLTPRYKKRAESPRYQETPRPSVLSQAKNPAQRQIVQANDQPKHLRREIDTLEFNESDERRRDKCPFQCKV